MLEARRVPWGIAFGQQLSTTRSSKLSYFPLATSKRPIEIFSSILDKSETAFILESVEGPRPLARYTFLGFDPQRTVRISNQHVELLDRRNSERRIETCRAPLSYLENLNTHAKEGKTGERYTGGLVGYVSYDLVRALEKIPRVGQKRAAFPDAEFGLFEDGIVFDHVKGRLYYFCRDENRIDRVRNLVKESGHESQVAFCEPKSNLSQEEFCDRVGRAKEYIQSGDIFQAVLSRRYKIPFKGSLLRFYRALRKINPSPYMYYLKFGDREVVGSSPEMLVRKTRRTVETFPIAGTRPFTSDPARNDLGRVCDYGTVQVPEFMKIQNYSHVQHIVSRVTGRLQRGATGTDVFKAVFPAGTVTGAPKVRAMQIIEELEVGARGPYAGAVGYFSSNGNVDFAITIRTLFAQHGNCYLQSGAGIVADSVPDREWIESERKTAALFTAMDQAQRDQV